MTPPTQLGRVHGVFVAGLRSYDRKEEGWAGLFGFGFVHGIEYADSGQLPLPAVPARGGVSNESREKQSVLRQQCHVLLLGLSAGE